MECAEEGWTAQDGTKQTNARWNAACAMDQAHQCCLGWTAWKDTGSGCAEWLRGSLEIR